MAIPTILDLGFLKRLFGANDNNATELKGELLESDRKTNTIYDNYFYEQPQRTRKTRSNKKPNNFKSPQPTKQQKNKKTMNKKAPEEEKETKEIER